MNPSIILYVHVKYRWFCFCVTKISTFVYHVWFGANDSAPALLGGIPISEPVSIDFANIDINMIHSPLACRYKHSLNSYLNLDYLNRKKPSIYRLQCHRHFISGRSRSKLTHWGRVTYICVSKLTIVGSDNGLSPGRRQAIIWTNDGILMIRALGTNFGEILIVIYIFLFKKMHLNMSSGNC